MATNGPEVISPVIISGDGAPAQITPAQTYAGPAYAPAPAAETSNNLATATISMPAGPAGGDTVQGFASQVPLALALRQILPVGYNFSIDQNIDMETLVSYQGGKSWRETLRDMLATPGLVAREQGATVTISRASSVAAAPAPSNNMAAMSPSAAAYDKGGGIDKGTPARYAGSGSMADLSSVNVGSPDGWNAERGDTLRKVLTQWCRRAGVELQWLAEYDYPMEASAHFNGSFEDAVRNMLAGFENARPQPVGELHTNPGAGQSLLVIQVRGNSYSN